ncbi:hypothetical protein AB1Y20_011075 [Prymnesium parvum]|uniref:Fungal lipase-type domain-containing protein n=1 Tax=Prymnesium parvum TaxID=97485 RepID=A0AB34IN19_PRYPA
MLSALFLAAAPLSKADPPHPWLADGWLSALAGGARRALEAAVDVPLPGAPLKHAQLQLPLLCSQLADLAYEETAAAVEAALARLAGGSLTLLQFHGQRLLRDEVWYKEPAAAQWLVARAADGTLFVVFRGTSSLPDILHDLQTMPCDGFHRGFLRMAERCTPLHELLRQQLKHTDHLVLVGHSLGGALALTLLGAGLVPPSAARITVMTYGSPAPFHRTCPSALRGAKVRSFVYGADVVPRLLGSDISLLAKTLERFSDEQTAQQRSAMLKTLSEYVHADHDDARLVFINPNTGDARVVPRRLIQRLLHIHQAVSSNAVMHHSEYTRGLQRAIRRAAAREGKDVDLL